MAQGAHEDTPDNEDLVLGPCNRDLSPRNSCSGPRNTNGGPPNTYGRPPLAASPLAISYISPCNCYFGPQNNYGGPCNTCGKPYHAHVGCSDPLWGEPRGPLRPAQLPADLLPHILEHIDCKQRLGECALVAPAWRTAAVAATEDIQLTLGNSTTVSASLVEWLRRSGSGMRSIDLEYRSNHSRYYDGDDDINPNLPFQQLAGLRSLSLVNSNPRLYCDGLRVLLHCHTPEHPSFHRQLGCMGSSLTSLKLHSIELSRISSGWCFLSTLTSLQHLDLQQAPAENELIEWDQARVGSGPELGQALTALSGLTQLRLEWEIDNTIKLALGKLTQLQQLRLHACEDAARCDSRLNLPHSLTHLDVKLSQDYDEICAPDLASLTALQHLQLQDAEGLDAGMMSGMAQLTHLQLCMAPNTFDDACMLKLLDVLSDNQQLRHLQLEFCNDDSLQNSMVAEQLLRRCSALTASSHLTSLQLSDARLPGACGRELFPAGRVLPHLTTLKLQGKAKPWSNHSITHGNSRAPIGPWRDIHSLVQCCPNLVDLDLAGSLQRGVDISELRDLWHLTSLVVGGESVDDQCAENLAQFSGLRALTVINPAKDKPDNREYDTDDDDDDDGDLNWLTRTVHCRGIYERSHFTFRGLRSLMQLKGLQVFAISRDTCLFQGVGSGDEDEYNDITAFQGCDDEDLHRLLQRNSKWHAFNTKEHQEQLAGVQQQVATLEWELAAAATRRESLDYEMRSQQREIDQQRCEIDDKQHTIEEKEYEIGWQQHEIVELQRMIVHQQGEIIDQQREAGDLQGRIVDQQGEIVDQQREIHHQQREIAGLQHEVWRLRQQQRYRQQEQWEQDQYEHRHSRRRQW